MRAFRYLRHTADLRIEIRGKDLKELFQNAGKAFFSVLTDRRKIKKNEKLEVAVTAESAEELLVNWLNELIYVFEVKKMVFGQIKILKLSKTELSAQLKGEKFNPAKHVIIDKPKAATYHLFKIEKSQSNFTAKVVFDL